MKDYNVYNISIIKRSIQSFVITCFVALPTNQLINFFCLLHICWTYIWIQNSQLSPYYPNNSQVCIPEAYNASLPDPLLSLKLSPCFLLLLLLLIKSILTDIIIINHIYNIKRLIFICIQITYQISLKKLSRNFETLESNAAIIRSL